jgi:hypothetical protein
MRRLQTTSALRAGVRAHLPLTATQLRGLNPVTYVSIVAT